MFMSYLESISLAMASVEALEAGAPAVSLPNFAYPMQSHIQITFNSEGDGV